MYSLGIRAVNLSVRCKYIFVFMNSAQNTFQSKEERVERHLMTNLK